jgi:hypothetical protein
MCSPFCRKASIAPIFATLPSPTLAGISMERFLCDIASVTSHTLSTPGIAVTVFIAAIHISFFSGDTYLSSMGGLQYGADLRWNTPLPGLLVGVSRMHEDISAKGRYISPFDPGAGYVPYFEYSKADWTNQFYVQYTQKRFTVESEYRRHVRDQIIMNKTSVDITDVRGWTSQARIVSTRE